MQSPMQSLATYDVQRTFINVSECVADDDTEDAEVPFDAFTRKTFPRKRRNTWDASMNRADSVGSGSTAWDSNDEDISQTTTGVSAAEETNSDGSPDSTSGNEAEPENKDEQGVNVVPTTAWISPDVVPEGYVPVGQWMPNEDGMLTLYCMGYVPAGAVMSQPQTGIDDAAFDPIAKANELRIRAAQMRVKAEILAEKRKHSRAVCRAKMALAERSSNIVRRTLDSVFEEAGDALDCAHSSGFAEDERTTIMLRNLPNDYTRDMVLELLDSEGFAGDYNFVYLPVDFQRWAGFGYAFVNLVTHADAERMKVHFHGFRKWMVGSVKVCDVCWGEPLQGITAHVERYRNSPVMHELVPDDFKPAIFNLGQRVEFPAPTKRLQPPRTHKYRAPDSRYIPHSAGLVMESQAWHGIYRPS